MKSLPAVVLAIEVISVVHRPDALDLPLQALEIPDSEVLCVEFNRTTGQCVLQADVLHAPRAAERTISPHHTYVRMDQ